MYTLKPLCAAMCGGAFAFLVPYAGAQTPGMAAGPLGISMDRMGSGTTWIPDAVSVPSYGSVIGAWDVMLHGFVFAQYDHQSGPRGDEQFGSLNWGMLMASRPLAGGRFQARTMLSLDPATVSNRGYPLLLQTGETYRGERLHDRQHPHDFIMELGLLYERAVTDGVGVSVYAAPSGEPALGPVAFMHRPSSMDMPTAPLGHHWQDATHIAFGVVSAGVFTRHWKLEGSVFNGREPNEDRWDFDRLRLDSYAGRLTVNPSANWSMTVGYGYLDSPESIEPDESTHRATASILHGARIGANGRWASSVVWGSNRHEGEPRATHSALVETQASFNMRHTVLARAEFAEKSAADLVVDTPVFGFASDRQFDLGSLSLGYIFEAKRWHRTTLGVGAIGTVGVIPAALDVAYGARAPTGLVVFLRLRASQSESGSHDMPGMRGMGHSGAH